PDFLILLGLAIVTFAIYAQLIGHRFITLDDPTYIQDNPMVNRGVTLAGLAWAFTTFYAGNRHPLTWIPPMIDSQLFRMIAGGHLLVNALIHAANTLLVFWFLFRTTHARWSSALLRRFLRCTQCTWNRSHGRLNARIRCPHFSAYCRSSLTC